MERFLLAAGVYFQEKKCEHSQLKLSLRIWQLRRAELMKQLFIIPEPAPLLNSNNRYT